MNHLRLRKLISAVASLRRDDPLRVKTEERLKTTGTEIQKEAAQIFARQEQFTQKLASSPPPPDNLCAKLLDIPHQHQTDSDHRSFLHAHWMKLACAAVLVLASWIAVHLVVERNLSTRRYAFATTLAHLKLPKPSGTASHVRRSAEAIAAHTKMGFKAVIPHYVGYRLTGFAVLAVGGRKGLVTSWRNEMGRPCTLVQLPGSLAQKLSVNKPVVIHVKNSTGLVTSTVTVWKDDRAGCTWAEILPGDVNFYFPRLTLHGLPI
ncbi:MAG: hypothetical protein ACP5O1_00295 [Phycisphaerae bacterium]